MTEGPLGGPRPFSKHKKSVLVLVGVSGPSPDKQTRLSVQESVNDTVNRALVDAGADIELTRQTVTLKVADNPSREQRNAVGRNAGHVEQYDVKTELAEIPRGLVNAIHNTVVEEVTNSGFSITGTETTVM